MFIEQFEKLILKLEKDLFNLLYSKAKNESYKTIWKHFEDILIPYLIDILPKEIPLLKKAKMTKSTSKSSYPDFKIKLQDKTYALDVKSGTDEKDPWYDIARLDTFKEKRLDVFEEEWDIVVKYNKSGEILNLYIEKLWQTVGFDKKRKCIKYRPYDGKLRPKPWEMFKNKENYFKDKKDFLKYFRKAIEIRNGEEIISRFTVLNKSVQKKILEKLKSIFNKSK